MHLGGQPQVGKAEEPARPCEQTHHGLLAMQRGKRGEPHLDLAGSSPDSPLLGHVGAVGQELRQDLEPGHHIGRQSGRQHRDRLEHAVDPPADLQPIGTGVKMDIAGLRCPSLRQDLLDNIGGIPWAGWVQASEILR